jgi:hypothetical protein
MLQQASLSRGAIVAAIFLVFATALAVDFIYAEARHTWLFDEYGPMTSAKAIASMLAGLLGVAIWQAMAPGTGKWTDGRYFWLLAGLGLIFMGFDDYFQVHETLGRESWERWQFDPPLFNHTDDMIVAVYGVAGLALVAVYWREIVFGGLSGVLLAGALAAAAVMTVVDATAEHGTLAAGVEDPAHVVSSALFLAAFAVKWREVSVAVEEAPMTPGALVTERSA